MAVADIQHYQWRYDTRNNLMNIEDEDVQRLAAILGAGLFSIAERLGSVEEAIQAQTDEMVKARELQFEQHATIYNFAQARGWRFGLRYRKWRRKIRKLMI